MPPLSLPLDETKTYTYKAEILLSVTHQVNTPFSLKQVPTVSSLSGFQQSCSRVAVYSVAHPPEETPEYQTVLIITLERLLTHRSGVCIRGRRVPQEPSTSPASDPVNTKLYGQKVDTRHSHLKRPQGSVGFYILPTPVLSLSRNFITPKARMSIKILN